MSNPVIDPESLPIPTRGVETPAWIDAFESTTWCGNSITRNIGAAFGNYPDVGEAVVIAFPRVRERTAHVLFVQDSLRVLWLTDDGVTADRVLEPRWERHSAPAHTLVEVHPETELPAAARTDGGDHE